MRLSIKTSRKSCFICGHRYNYRGLPRAMRNLPKWTMVTNPAASRTQEHSALQRMLGRGRFLSLLVLFGVLAMCIAFSWTTRDAMAHLPFLKGQKAQAGATGQTTIVDLHPWQIAQALAPLAVSKEEEEFASFRKR